MAGLRLVLPFNNLYIRPVITHDEKTIDIIGLLVVPSGRVRE